MLNSFGRRCVSAFRTQRRYFGQFEAHSFRILDGKINTESEIYKENYKYNEKINKELKELVSSIRKGGSENARNKHTKRGKLLVRDRIDKLLDEGSPFLEFSQLAGYKLYEDNVPAGGVVTGVGTIHGWVGLCFF